MYEDWLARAGMESVSIPGIIRSGIWYGLSNPSAVVSQAEERVSKTMRKDRCR